MTNNTHPIRTFSIAVPYDTPPQRSDLNRCTQIELEEIFEGDHPLASSALHLWRLRETYGMDARI